MDAETISVLLVSDNDADALLVRNGFREANLENPIYRVRDGLEALSMLRGVHGRAAIPWPRLILIDGDLAPAARAEFLEALQERAVYETDVVFLLGSAETAVETASGAAAPLLVVSKAELVANPERIAMVFEHFWSFVTRGTRRPPAA